MKYSRKFKITALAILACLGTATLSAQSVGLQLGVPNFADSLGNPVPTGTMFGIVVDTDGSGFAVGEWGPSSFIAARADQTAPFYSFINDSVGTETTNAFVARQGSAAFGPNQGLFGAVNQVPHAAGDGIAATGAQFGIIWFPGLAVGDSVTAGQSYGFYTNQNLTIPQAGSDVPFGDFITNDIKTADYTIVPEPSTYAAIFGFGVLLFVFLRRRFKK